MPTVLLVGTRKGAFIVRGDEERRRWELDAPLFLGQLVNHVVQDPRDPQTLLAAARTGHLGPTIFRSGDFGKSWQEASGPPAFAKGEPLARAVDYTMCVVPAHASEPGVWYAGTSPQALFRSEDAGDTWQPVSGWNDHAQWLPRTGDGQDGTPGGPMLHTVLVDPRDSAHLYFAMSGGGVYESLDRGENWSPLNQGLATVEDPDPDQAPAEGAAHDPHCVKLHPQAPDVLYQQNHCGIYRLERPGTRWERIGDNMPRDIGDIGFPIELHPRDPATAWVIPMDGTDVWPRTSPDGIPSLYRTSDSGRSWTRLDRGLPQQGWYTVLRQCMAVDADDPVGLYFGTTSGELWASRNEGERWSRIAAHLQQILSVESAEFDA
jgi:photosystem II stability/assembly factor-like uncharacterized protein